MIFNYNALLYIGSWLNYEFYLFLFIVGYFCPPALAYQCCDVDPKKRPTASMCVEELELIAIEWRIDEHENKSRARALSFSGGSPGKAAATTATGTAAAFAERSNEAFQNSQMIDEEQKEISQ